VTPGGHDERMAPSTAQEFAHTARSLTSAAHRLGLVVPSFRSPPGLRGADRSLRRRRLGAPVVSVRLQGRPSPAVMADMVEGVVVANGLDGAEADATRRALWEAIEPARSNVIELRRGRAA
jgi:hypothetical protein